MAADETHEGVNEPEPQPAAAAGKRLDPEENWVYDLAGSGLMIQEVAGKVLGLTDHGGDHLTRRFIKPTVTPGGETGETTVEIDVHHQRRRNPGVPYSALDLRSLKGGDWTHVPMDSSETLRLFKHLEALYAIGATGVTRYPRQLRVVDADEVTVTGPLGDVVTKLREEHGDEALSTYLESLAPDLVGAIALKIEHARRLEAIDEFESHMRPSASAEVWTEPQWKAFFKRNEWIFGHNLDYQFLTDEMPEAYVGGRRPSGGGSQLADHVMGTGGDWSFAVLVEIKKPNTPLLGAYYREGTYKIGGELGSSVAQAQANCQALIRMSSTADGAREFDAHELTVSDPRGIVLIGDTIQLAETAQKETFQRFRHNLWNPTVMTYDELLNRAKFQVARTAPPESATSTEVARPRAAGGASRGRLGRTTLPAFGAPTARARPPFADPGPFVVVGGPGLTASEPAWGLARQTGALEEEPDEEPEEDEREPAEYEEPDYDSPF